MTDVDRHTWRSLDVNINRASEGLRVLEDMARLFREDRPSAELLKELRHGLSSIVSGIDRSGLLAARSTEHDPGTALTSSAEQTRTEPESILRAEAARVGQALRALEEFSKLIDPSVSQQFKQLRYRAYDQLARIELKWTLHAWLNNAPLCILIDCQKPIDLFAEYLLRLCDAGANFIQIRDKQTEGRELVKYAAVAVKTLERYEGHVIVNDRVDVALASGAAGVHVGQEDLHPEEVRKLAGSRLAIGLSTHSIDQAREAVKLNVDYIGCGPSFPSQTKSFSEFAGPAYLRQVAAEITLPAYAIGGVNLQTLDQVIASGIKRVAVTAAVHQATDPAQAVRELAERLHLAYRR